MKKRKLFIILAIICVLSISTVVVFLISSQSSLKDGNIYIMGYSDGASTNSFINWFDLFPEYEVKAAKDERDYIGTEKSIVIQGVTYKGVYQGIESGTIGTDQIRYKFGGEGFTFSLSQTNGKLTSFRNPNIEVTNNPMIDEEKGKKIVYDFLKDIIDIENFQYMGIGSYSLNNCREYRFQRCIDGILCRESIRIVLNGDGSIVTYSSCGLFDLEGVTTLKGFNKEEAIKTIKEQVKKYESEQDVYKYEVLEDSGTLQVLNGKILYAFDIDRTKADGFEDELIEIAYVICDAP